MSQYDELKRLAINCRTERCADEDEQARNERDFLLEIDPEEILALIAENDDLQSEIAGLKTGYQACERVNAELKAENERLHKVASELRQWISCNHVHHEPHEQHGDDVHCKVLERIDAALGKGE